MAVSGRARPLSGLLETDPFTSSVTYDALNRPVSVTTPDHSVYRPTFNEANLLDRVDVNLRGATANGQPSWTPFVTNLNYNAKGQRALIAYANGATTTYTYDPATFRLTHLQTTRLPGNGLATHGFFSIPALCKTCSIPMILPVTSRISLNEALLGSCQQ